MLVHEGDQRTLFVDLRLAALLAGAAGALNAAGFQATGFFSANMTGNVSALSDRLGLGEFRFAGLFAGLVMLFIAGAYASGLLIEIGRKRGIRAIYAYSIALEAMLLVGLGLSDVLVQAHNEMAIVLGMSFVMGLQNAATTRISDARVRTTHVSGMATDIGISLANLTIKSPDTAISRARLWLHLSTIVAFLFGGVIGVMLYIAVGGYLFLLIATGLFAIALPEVRRAKRGADH